MHIKIAFIILLITSCVIFSACQASKLTPEQKALHEQARAELQETSNAFEILAVLNGDYSKEVGFVGKIWVRAKFQNNTKYCFALPVSLFIAAKDFKVIENKIGNRWPDKGIFLLNPSLDFSPWKPNEMITVTGEIDVGNKDLQSYEWEFLAYLTKILVLPANEPVKIDSFVKTFYGMATPFPIDCSKIA